MVPKLNEDGDLVVRGRLEMGSGYSGHWSHTILPSCECCGCTKQWNMQDYPEEWGGKGIEVRVRLLSEEV